MIVAHDVNPILGSLDRVVYLAGGGAASGKPRDVITTETLSRLYGTPIEVLDDVRRPARRRRPARGRDLSPRAAPTRSRPWALTAAVTLTWNLVDDVRNALAFHFMRRTRSAPERWSRSWPRSVGWFMVLRRETFAGHTLAVVGFPGAAGAVWLGLSAVAGYFGFCVAAALMIAGIQPRRPARVRRGVGRDRNPPGVRARVRVPVREPLRRASSTASARCCSAASSA